MQIFDLFNITHPVLTVPITIIIGLIFLTVLFNLFKNSFFSQISKARRVGVLEKYMAFSKVD